MKKLKDLHSVKIRELNRKYIMPEDLDTVLIEDNTMRPYVANGSTKMYLPSRHTSLNNFKKM